MIPLRFFIFLGCAVALLRLDPVLAADADSADLDDEDSTPEYRPTPGSEWKEDEVDFPPYPSPDGLLDINLPLKDSSFTVLIDPDSVSVGKDRVVRYTVALSSASGASNVTYEGIRCSRRMVKRYAYGSAGRFSPARNSDWRYVKKLRQDEYLAGLIDNFFCPLPGLDAERQIVRKLKKSASRKSFLKHDLEE